MPTTLKKVAKRWLRRARLARVPRGKPFSPPDFLLLLRRLDVRAGDVLMVHSSYDRFRGFTGKPVDVLAALQTAVGPEGTILMPTLSFEGLAVDYAARGEVFDVKRTPSRMGLLTELFRRRRSVVRSVHPTHSVAAWGANAQEMVAGHHVAGTPCGAGTPFSRLLEYDGKILLLGTGIEAMTFFHTVEEILESRLPVAPFTRESFSLLSRDSTGQILVTRTRLWDPQVAHRRRPGKLVAALKQRGVWKKDRVGRLDAIILNAQDVLNVLRALADKGVYCYDQGRLAEPTSCTADLLP